MGPSVDPESSTIQVGCWVGRQGGGLPGSVWAASPGALLSLWPAALLTDVQCLCSLLIALPAAALQELKEWANQFGTSSSKQGLQSRRLSYFT